MTTPRVDEIYLRHLEAAWETVRGLKTKAAADSLMVKLMLTGQPILIAEIRRQRALLAAEDGGPNQED